MCMYAAKVVMHKFMMRIPILQHSISFGQHQRTSNRNLPPLSSKTEIKLEREIYKTCQETHRAVRDRP